MDAIPAGWRMRINGNEMQCPAWLALNVDELVGRLVRRSESVLIPFAAGRRPTPPVRDEFTADLNLWVDGARDRDGVANPTGVGVGLAVNRAALSSCLEGATVDDWGTTDADLVDPADAVVSTRVQVVGITYGPAVGGLAACPVAVTLKFPRGGWL